jgi:hypothetical protein
MAGLVPAIHVFLCRRAPESKTWMPATSAGMTTERLTQLSENRCRVISARTCSSADVNLAAIPSTLDFSSVRNRSVVLSD